jgi:hypothetical protein
LENDSSNVSVLGDIFVVRLVGEARSVVVDVVKNDKDVSRNLSRTWLRELGASSSLPSSLLPSPSLPSSSLPSSLYLIFRAINIIVCGDFET